MNNNKITIEQYRCGRLLKEFGSFISHGCVKREAEWIARCIGYGCYYYTDPEEVKRELSQLEKIENRDLQDTVYKELSKYVKMGLMVRDGNGYRIKEDRVYISTYETIGDRQLELFVMLLNGKCKIRNIKRKFSFFREKKSLLYNLAALKCSIKSFGGEIKVEKGKVEMILP